MTGQQCIGTYIWVLTNKKVQIRKGMVQLIDATSSHSPMRKSEGNKRRSISDEQIAEIARLYADFEDGERVRIVNHRDFGYRRIKVQRPLRLVIRITDDGLKTLEGSKPFGRLDVSEQKEWLNLLRRHTGKSESYTWLDALAGLAVEAGLGKIAKPLAGALEAALGVRDPEAPTVIINGVKVPDKDLEDFENVPLDQSVDEYLAEEVLPHVPDAWIDGTYIDDQDKQRGKVGYEINFNRYFYKYAPSRDVREIDAELKAVEREIAELLDEVAE